MKKTYLSPNTKVYEIESNTLLAASSVINDNKNFIESEEEEIGTGSGSINPGWSL